MHPAVTYRAAPRLQMQQPVAVELDQGPLLQLLDIAAASNQHSQGMFAERLFSPCLSQPPYIRSLALAHMFQT